MIWMMAQDLSGISGVICSLVSGAGQAAELDTYSSPPVGSGGSVLFIVILKTGTQEPGLRKGSVNMAVSLIINGKWHT